MPQTMRHTGGFYIKLYKREGRNIKCKVKLKDKSAVPIVNQLFINL